MELHSGARGMAGVGQVLLYCLGLIGLTIVMGVAVGVLAIAVLPSAKTAIAAGTFAPQALALMIFGVLLPIYVVLFWALQLVTYCWLWIPIIKHLATTLDIDNFAAVNEIAQSSQKRPKLGIADSFELGAF
jgi:hypothetical protein